MTMPNGSQPPQPVVRGQNVAPTALSFEVSAKVANTPEGPMRLVVLRLEHSTGSGEFVMPSDFAAAISRALLAASSGLQIARGTPPHPGAGA